MLRTLILAATLSLAAVTLVACGDDDSTQVLPPVDVGDPDAGCVGPDCADVGPDATDECPDGEELVDGVCVLIVESPFTCDITPSDACGGDLLGTWTYVNSCELETPVNLFEGACGGGVFNEYWFYNDYTGTMTFDDDGTYRAFFDSTTFSVSALPISCGGFNDCDILADAWGLGVCAEVDQICECSNDEPNIDTEDYQGTYAVEGTSVHFDADDASSPFCIQGDTMFMRRYNIDSYEPLLLERTQ